MMHFYNLEASYLFLVLIGLFFLLWVSQKRKKRALEAFAQRDLLTSLMSSVDPRRQRQRAILSLMVLAFGILALMRPQMGFRWEEGRRHRLDILVAMDVSKSMLADDLKPNRLEYAKQAVRDWVKTLKGDRVGLIAFSGEAFLSCPLTTDYSAFLLSLDGMGSDTLPLGGTNISGAIREALRSYRRGRGEKVLLLLTDGEDHEGNPLHAAEAAQKERIRIYPVGIGTREGGLIPMADRDHQRGFLKDDQGNVIKSTLNEGLLEKLASMGGGTYVRGGGERSVLKRIYDQELSGLEKGEFEGSLKKRDREWFQIPIAVVLLLSLLELFLNERKKPIRLKSRGVLGLVLLLFLPSFFACGNKTPEKAYQLYGEGKYEEAQKTCETILATDPDSDLWNYNLGAVLYRRGDYSGAIEHLVKALATDDPGLEAKANYNMGNCKVRLAEKTERIDLGRAIDQYREALDYYQRAMELDEKDEDARVNHAQVEVRLKNLEALLKAQEAKPQKSEASPKQQEKPYPAPYIASASGHPGQKETGSQAPEQQGRFKPAPPSLSKDGKDGTTGQEYGNRIEMSKEEAEILLERYQQGEGLLALSTMRRGSRALPEVKKNW